jgi:putative ABC transport system ATP-binding protein
MRDLCKVYWAGNLEIIYLKVSILKFIPVSPGHNGSFRVREKHSHEHVGCLDRPTCGQVILMGQDINTITDSELARLRALKLVLCSRTLILLPRLSAIQNNKLPTYANVKNGVEPNKRANELVKLMGLEDRFNNRPSQLSEDSNSVWLSSGPY